jgi:hypothetical protein
MRAWYKLCVALLFDKQLLKDWVIFDVRQNNFFPAKDDVRRVSILM